MKISWLVFALATIVGYGCASAPVHYYTLTPASKLQSQSPTPPCCLVEMKKVTVPVEVDRAELVTSRSDEELDVLSNDVWLAPLPDEIRSALLAGIRRGISNVAGAALPARRFNVVVDVRRFESMMANHVLIQAQWRIDAAGIPKPTVPFAGEATATIKVAAGVPALVQGYQRAIGEIADRIVANIIALEGSGDLTPIAPAQLGIAY